MRLPLALLLGAAYALHPPPTNGLRKRNLYRTQTQYKTDSADGAGSFDRAVDALRAKGDAAAVKALQADVADIVVKIDGHDVDVTDYAREHPGGAAVLRKFHGRDASKAFHAAKHSKAALDRMKALQPDAKAKPVSRASKLFTHEDRSQVHKVLGLWCLGHYVVRIHRGIWSADPTGGLAGLGAVPWLLPHALLSLSSIKFHVPRERIAKKPMIWQEFRMHNIIFALRSFVCAALAAASLHASTITRQRAAVGAACTVFASLIAADVATCVETKLRARWRGGSRRSHTGRHDQAARGRVRDDDGDDALLGRRLPRDHQALQGLLCVLSVDGDPRLFGQRQPALAALHRAAHPARVAADDVGAQGPADGARLPPPLHGVALRAVRRR